MRLNVEVYIGADRLDLFDDENIEMNRTVKDFRDLDKVFSDFTQSFTIPASKQNNIAMSHWYDESLATGFNPATKKAARIDINTLPFRSGYIWLKRAVLKNGSVDFYEVEFFSEMTNLNEIFGKDTLPELGTNVASSLDYDSFTDALQDRVGASNNVLIPMATSQRNWTLEGFKTLGSINANELPNNPTYLQRTLSPSTVTDPQNRFNTSINCFKQDSGSGTDLFAVTLIPADPTATWKIEARDEQDNYSSILGATAFNTGAASDIVSIPENIPFQNVAFMFQHFPSCEFKLIITSTIGGDDQSTQCVYDYYQNGGLLYELKPALRADVILEAIQSKYGITFSSDFFNTNAWRDIYVWANREEGFGNHYKMDYVQLTGGTEIIDTNGYWSTGSNELQIPAGSGALTFTVGVTVLQSLYDEMNNTLPTPTVTLLCMDYTTGSGVLYEEVNFEPNLVNSHDFEFPDSGDDKDFKFFVKSSYPELFNWVISGDELLIEKEREEFDNDSSCVFYFTDQSYTDAQTGETKYIKGGLPAQKVSEWLAGIIKMFNLVITPTSNTTFDVKTLDDWKSGGVEIDVTKYIDNSEVSVQPAELYSEIKFGYEETESIIGQEFRNINGVGYGDLELEIRDTFGDAISSEKFEIKVPFDNPSWSRLTNYAPHTANAELLSELLAMQYINKNLETIKSKTVMFYYAEQINLETANETKYSFRKFYREVLGAILVDKFWKYNLCFQYNTDDDSYTHSLNFGSEVNPFTLTDGTATSPTIYKSFWEDYITDLYDLSMRRTMLKAILPLHLMLDIKVNDVLTINTKKYTINNMRLNLTTGEAMFELLTLVE